MPDPPARQVRAQWGALFAVLLVLALPAKAAAFEFTPSWGYAYIDDKPFHDLSGRDLPSGQAFPRGYIRDTVVDGKDVRIRVWAFDANGDPLAHYDVDEGDFVNKSFDAPLDVSPNVIRYMRFDFCVFVPGGSSISCLDPPHYIGRPPPKQQPPPPPPGEDPPSSDVDGDGHATPADCDDRNSRVHPGAAEMPGNGLDDDCDGSDRPGRVAAGIQIAWSVRGARTRVDRFRVYDAPPGAAVAVACLGRGCPFKARSFGVDGSGKVALTKLFHRRLRPRTRLEVRVAVPGAIGKVVRYRTRRGKVPRARYLCLPPGATEPARCPAA